MNGDVLLRLIHQRMRDLGMVKRNGNLNYSELARQTGIPRPTVYTLATNTQWSRPPEPRTLERLARGLDLPLVVVLKAAYEAAGWPYEEVKRGDRLALAVGDLDGMSDLDLLELQEAINSEQRRRHERDRS